MYATTRGVGQYVASESHTAVTYRGAKPNAVASLVLQGSHGISDTLWWSSDADSLARTQAIAEAGYHQISGDLSQTLSQGTFGNSTSATRVGQLKTYVQNTLGAKSGAVHIRSGSGGFAAAVRYAKVQALTGSLAIKSIIGMNPLVDLRDFHDNNRGSFAAEVETAYTNAGTTYAADVANGNASEPSGLALISSIPFLLFYATDDPYIPVSTVTAFQAAIQNRGGTCELVSMGAVGHTAPAASAPAATVLDFMARHP